MSNPIQPNCLTFHICSFLDVDHSLNDSLYQPATKGDQIFERICLPIVFAGSLIVSLAETTTSVALATLAGIGYILTGCSSETVRIFAVKSLAYGLHSISCEYYLFQRCVLNKDPKPADDKNKHGAQIVDKVDSASKCFIHLLFDKDLGVDTNVPPSNHTFNEDFSWP